MYKKIKHKRSSIERPRSVHYEGESIEKKVERFMVNKTPITDKTDIIYTERKNGVIPETDIRHDKWEAAAESMDVVAGAHMDKREKPKGTKIAKDPDDKGGNTAGGEPINATDGPGKK